MVIIFTLITELIKVNRCRTMEGFMAAGRRAAVAERHLDAGVDFITRHISGHGKHVDS